MKTSHDLPFAIVNDIGILLFVRLESLTLKNS